jgi:hypothetical protein
MIKTTSMLAATILSAGTGLLIAQGRYSTANAQGTMLVAGTLTCQGKGSVGLIVGSQQNLSCVYVPAGGGGAQNYAGTITKVGLDVGFTTGSVMIWTVLGSSTALRPGVLAGNYAGASAGATVALGAGANALVGGSNNAVVLQPLSVQGQTGLNLAVGVTGLTLRR